MGNSEIMWSNVLDAEQGTDGETVAMGKEICSNANMIFLLNFFYSVNVDKNYVNKLLFS